MASRFYQLKVDYDRPIFFEDFGGLVRLAGMVFQAQHQRLVLLFPGHNLSTPKQTTLSISANEWDRILKASDDPKFIGPDKAWHRKARHQISGIVQQRVLKRDGCKCQACGKEMGEVLLTIDHWIPLALGGPNDDTNYITLCSACNKRKGDMPPRAFCKRHGHNYGKLSRIAKTKLCRVCNR